jgi:chromate transporter
VNRGRPNHGWGAHRFAPHFGRRNLPSRLRSLLLSQLIEKADSLAPARSTSLLQIFLGFGKMSVISWGGGTATIYAMTQEMERRGWSSRQQFMLDFGISRIAPGINLLTVAVMVGYRLRGIPGAAAATAGLTMPASLITLALTAVFAQITANAIGESAVRGAVAITAALTFAFAIQTGLEVTPWRERRVALLMVLFVIASFLAVAFWKVSVVLIIIVGGVGGAFLFRPSASGTGPDGHH